MSKHFVSLCEKGHAHRTTLGLSVVGRHATTTTRIVIEGNESNSIGHSRKRRANICHEQLSSESHARVSLYFWVVVVVVRC